MEENTRQAVLKSPSQRTDEQWATLRAETEKRVGILPDEVWAIVRQLQIMGAREVATGEVNAAFVQHYEDLADFAEQIGNTEDIARYRACADTARTVMRDRDEWLEEEGLTEHFTRAA